MASDLELDRARAQAQVDQVLARSHYEKKVRDQGSEHPTFCDILLALLRDLGLKALKVPADFPLELADFLRPAGFRLEPVPAPLFAERQLKTPEEISSICQALQAGEGAMNVAVDTIRAATLRDQILYWEGEILTSERLRRMIHLELVAQNCTAEHTIVAGGDESCDPHAEGRGPLRAGETIVIDIFPRSSASGYFGDITRTVVKGQAPAAVKALFETVHRGQELALGAIGTGADSRQIHQDVLDLFTRAGYETGEKDGHMQGFFHSTGHGLGLEIHEPPRIGPQGSLLETGQVVTVEPGLYYPGVGGVRLEDVVVVEEDGCRNLTTFPRFLEV